MHQVRGAAAPLVFEAVVEEGDAQNRSGQTGPSVDADGDGLHGLPDCHSFVQYGRIAAFVRL